MTELEGFRLRKDQLFAQPRESPLSQEQRQLFSGLAYFPENPDLVIASTLVPHPDRTTITIETTGGDGRPYRRAGIVRFKVSGQSAQLTLFESDGDDQLFLPFRDATSGQETYGSGRYREVGRPHHGRIVVDFNYAYNPYCAYNAHWSCPLPPRENWLTVRIIAGEMTFPDHAQH